MDLRDNRVFVNLTAVRPDGSKRSARFWVDTGGGAVILSESFVRDMRLKAAGAEVEEGRNAFQPVEPPKIQMAGMPIDFSGVPALAAVGSTAEAAAGSGAEGILPGRLLKKYEVVFDYPGRKFTLAQPGALKPRGISVPAPIQPETGFPRVQLTVRGQQYGFLLDTGAAYTMVSQAAINGWLAANPNWPHSIGAVGPANMVGRSFDRNVELLRIPQLEWGPFQLRGVGAGSRRPGVFEKYMSSMMTGPIVGSLAGNVLRVFRIQIDYAHGVIYLEKHADVNPHDLDVAGIIVRAQSDGSYIIDGVAEENGKPLFDKVEPRDKLLRVGDRNVTGTSLADVLRGLRGSPGQTKTLVVERADRQVTVTVPVTRLP